MESCPSCKAVLKPNADKCPVCGVSINRKSAGPTRDNEMLKKDRWSFTGVQDTLQDKPQFDKTVVATEAPSEKISEAPVATEIRASKFDKTIAMEAINPTAANKQRKESDNGEWSVRPSGTVAFETPITKDELKKIGVDKTIQGRQEISGAHLTVPLQLGAEQSTQIKIPAPATAKKQPRMTAPIPLTNEAATKKEVPKKEALWEEAGVSSDLGVEVAPSESEVYVESDSKRRRATPPSEIATPFSTKKSSRGPQIVKTRLGSIERKGSAGPWFGIASVILIGTWFVPNVLVAPLVFPMELIKTVRGLDLVALVTTPFIGAIVLTLLIAPLSRKARAFLVLLLGLASLAVPLLLGAPALPLPGYIVLAVVIAAAGASLVIQTQTAKSLLGHITLALLPATFIAVALYGFFTSKLPMENIVVLKDPLIVYAGMLLVAVSAEELFS